MILLSTSPDPSGASNVLNAAVNSISHFGGVMKGRFSLPSFYDNFDMSSHIISNDKTDSELKNIVECLNI